MIEVEARRAVREPPAFSRRHDADEKRVGAKMVSPRRGWVARALGRQKKLSPKEIRFLIYTAVALCMVAAYTTTGEEHTTRTREADKFVDHRREVGESTLVLDEPVVENVTEAFDFGDEEHVIVIDLRPEDPTHKYMDPNAKSSLKNIKEAIKNEGKKKEVVKGQEEGGGERAVPGPAALPHGPQLQGAKGEKAKEPRAVHQRGQGQPARHHWEEEAIVQAPREPRLECCVLPGQVGGIEEGRDKALLPQGRARDGMRERESLGWG